MSSASKIQLSSFDDLFGASNAAGEVIEVVLTDLYPFKNHPFKVLDNEEMDTLVQSIQLHGKVLNPALVRPRAEGGYELISGHRRQRACEIAGLSTMPVIVREMTDEEATLIMVDSNIQREHLLFSEKAFAYKMKYDALAHQGSKMDKHTFDEIGEDAGESGRNIQRYIRLTELFPRLLEFVDEGRLGFVAAVDLSFLQMQEQILVYERILNGLSVNGAKAAKLKKYSLSGELTDAMLDLILSDTELPKQKYVMKQDTIRKYFTEEYSSEEIEEVILSLLDQWEGRRKEG